MHNDNVLLNVFQEIKDNRSVLFRLTREGAGILTELGVAHDVAVPTIQNFVIDSTKVTKIKDISLLEESIHKALKRLEVYGELRKGMTERANLTCSQFSGCVSSGINTVLDIGGGSGEIASILKNRAEVNIKDITVADVLNWIKYPEIPFIQITEDKEIHVEPGSVDMAMLLTVLHHSDDPNTLIKKSFRVPKKRMIIIESVTEDTDGFLYGAWIDWFYNRCIHYSKDESKKINVPCNFLPAEAWIQKIFALTGKLPIISKKLGIYQFLNPENHHLIVYDLER